MRPLSVDMVLWVWLAGSEAAAVAGRRNASADAHGLMVVEAASQCEASGSIGRRPAFGLAQVSNGERHAKPYAPYDHRVVDAQVNLVI